MSDLPGSPPRPDLTPEEQEAGEEQLLDDPDDPRPETAESDDD
jgi:hypothetical protein